MAGNGEELPVDALIVTAVKDEYEAVLAVDTGAVEGSGWEKRTGSTGLEVAYRSFEAEGGVLRIAVTQALGMGGVEAVSASAQLIPEHEVRCLAMCGVCAGLRGDVELGDVIIADRLWQYDTGKSKVEIKDGERIEHEQSDIEMYRIHPPAWKHEAERFQLDRSAKWLAERPLSYEAQGNWILERITHGADPATDPEQAAKCPDFEKALERLWTKKLLIDATLDLTEAGRTHIKRLLLLNKNKLPEPKDLRAPVGPIASGNRVIEDAEIFKLLKSDVRKVLGVEMEAAAIGALAYARQLPYAVVMKAVMDHADPDKSDNFKPFAARASAECLIAFLRQHLPPREPKNAKPNPLDDILVPGTSDLPAKASPAALLNARHEVVDFFGREELIAKLRAWCEEDEKTVGTRLIYGAGGMGKTRLFIELCRRLREEAGWRAGFVPKSLPVERFAELVADDRPTLAVIDYAESRPNLLALLEPVAKRRNDGREGRVRVVLLARNAGDWWDTLLRADGDVKDLLSEEMVLALAPLVPVASERDALFRRAVEGFAKHLAKPVPEQQAPSLENERFERVLYVEMAALAYVEGRSFSAESLMDDTLDHEERFWPKKFGPQDDLDEQILIEEIRRVVSAATLLGGVASRAEVNELALRITEEWDQKRTLFLHALYPGQQKQEAAYLSGLEPDLLGEAMVWRTLEHEGTGAGAYLDRVFESTSESALRAGFTVLGRLSEEHAEAEAWIARLLDCDVAGRALPAFKATKTVGERTAHSPIGKVLARALEREGTLEIAKRIEEAGLPKQTVLLREVALWATETLLAHVPEGPEALAERARLLNNRSVEQSELGLHEQALASTQEAVDLYRKLAAARPDAFLPYLAMSLNNLGKMQSELGLHEQALASVQEAFEAIWPFFMALPRAFAPRTAMVLRNVFNGLDALDREPTPELLQRMQTFVAKTGDAGAGEG